MVSHGSGSFAWLGPIWITIVANEGRAEEGAEEMNEEKLTRLLEIGRELSETRELNPLLESAMQQALSFVGAKKGYIVLLDGDNLIFRVGLDHEGQSLDGPSERISRTIFNEVITTGKGKITADAASSVDAASVLALNIRSVMCAPLISRGKILGAVYVENRTQRNFFNLDDLKLLEFFAAQAAVSIENAMLNDDLEGQVKARTQELAEANEKLYQLAITDPLTGLHNRRHFFELANLEIAAAQRYERPLSVMMMDLDHFKNVNDTYGHLAGDQVLKAFAKRTLECVREVDVIGRYGGEEFALLLPNTDLSAAVEMGERLRLAISAAPVHTEEADIPVTVSIGATQYPFGSELTSDALFDRADQALYEAKKGGRNRVCRFFGSGTKF
jgi:diguanylate cyclase (GGDEF)-like protein